MIRLIIFDLDGVLVDAKPIHFRALNEALAQVDPKYVIDLGDHLSAFDGLPTKQKLEILSRDRGLPRERHDKIWKLKQEKTAGAIRSCLGQDERLRAVLASLKKKYKVYVASNSVRESVRTMLCQTGLIEYIDHYLSNEDVRSPKPHSEIYLRCMVHAGVNPRECLIIEDSQVGRQAATASGAHVLGVECPDDVTLERIQQFIDELEDQQPPVRWSAANLVVLIPMAGAGHRFQQAGYTFPKPLIDVHGKPMIQVVVENLAVDARYVFVVQQEHYNKYNLKHLLSLIAPNCEIIQVEGLTEGAACTTLLAEKFIDNDHHLLLANSDQFLEWDSGEFLYATTCAGVDGSIVTFEGTHPKWSFVRVEGGRVVEVAEKKPISNIANTGIYFWKKGSDYVKYAKQMIQKNVRVGNEFYVAPVYNEAIQDGKKIVNFQVKGMWGLGTPEDLQYYLQNYKGKK